jgi:outer membrane murein-binding lipoprotein Lpp
MKKRNYVKTLITTCALITATLAVSLLSGCVSSSKTQSSSASVGQQLQDLEQSYKDGIITKKEYERLKKAIIKQND